MMLNKQVNAYVQGHVQEIKTTRIALLKQQQLRPLSELIKRHKTALLIDYKFIAQEEEKAIELAFPKKQDVHQKNDSIYRGDKNNNNSSTSLTFK